MSELIKRPPVVTQEQKVTYAGIYLLKIMDLKPEDGGMDIPVLLPAELAPLEPALHKLHVDDRIEVNRRKDLWKTTKKGFAYIDQIIAESESLVEQYEEEDLEDAVEDMRSRNLDVMRARFLWGWFEGEFDDLIVFQQQRGISPVEEFWAYFLMSDDFYDNLALELAG